MGGWIRAWLRVRAASLTRISKAWMKKWLLVWLLARYDHSTARAANQSCVSLQCCLCVLRCDFFIALLSLLSIFLSLSLEPLYPGLAGFNGLHRAYFPLYPGALDSPDFVPRSCRAVPGRVLPPSMPTYGYLSCIFPPGAPGVVTLYSENT